jgi:hypothetical protein
MLPYAQAHLMPGLRPGIDMQVRVPLVVAEDLAEKDCRYESSVTR